jgi:hypothetical protein
MNWTEVLVGTKSAWTAERRASQGEMIRTTKPWEKSTGPRTDIGKAKSSRNAYAGDWYHEAMGKLAEVNAYALDLFDRKRRPKMPRF